MTKSPRDELPASDVAKRMDAALKRSLTMPPKQHKAAKPKTPPKDKGGAKGKA